MGPNGSGKSTLSYVIAGKADYEVLDGEILLDGQNILEMAPDERAARGPVPGLPVSAGNPRRRDDDLPEGGAERAAQGARRGRADHAGLHQARQRCRGQARDPEGNAASAPSMSASPAARRSAWRSCRWRCSSRRFCMLDETDSGLDIDALRDRGRRRQRAALAGPHLPRHHALSASPEPHRARTPCM